ncbi:MAG: DUF1566 domain-containing protein [Thermodesulfobacteriota bacterium]
MGMFKNLDIGNDTIKTIDWEMTPDMTFGTYESWGGRERVRNNSERILYFFIDNWGEVPKLCLMERGVKHAKVVAEIEAPVDMVKECVRSQGSSSFFERSYAIDDALKQWLKSNVVEAKDNAFVVPLKESQAEQEYMGDLPKAGSSTFEGEQVVFPSEFDLFTDEEAEAVIKKWNFFDAELNPEGDFGNHLVDNDDGLTVTDLRTGLMWQRGGLDINSIRSMQRVIEQIDGKEGYGGHDKWRLPTLEEAMSLMERERNPKGLYLDNCFSKEQPFIFVAAKRKPGGYWFVDYKQGRSFWSSGTIPGGFGRLCRTIE